MPAEASLRFGGGGGAVATFSVAAFCVIPFFRLPLGSGAAGLGAADGFAAPGGGALTSGRKGARAQQAIARLPSCKNYHDQYQEVYKPVSEEQELTTCSSETEDTSAIVGQRP